MDIPPPDSEHRVQAPRARDTHSPNERTPEGVSALGMVVRNMCDAVVIVDNQLRVVEINDAGMELLGLSRANPRLTLTPDVDPGEVHDSSGRVLGFNDAIHIRCLAGETIRGAEQIIRRRDGSTRHVVVDGAPIRGQLGEVVMAVIVARDVTRIRALEARTRETLEGLRTQRESLMCVIDNVPAGVLLLDSDLRILIANKEYLRYMKPCGRLRHGIRLERALPNAERCGLTDILREALRTGQPARFHEMRYDGLESGPVYWRGSAVPTRMRLRDRPVDVVIVVALDVTEEITSRAAIEEACRREHIISDKLQTCFLPGAFPRIRGFDIAHRHRPGLDEALIGGDFYDAFRLSDGRFGLVIGDVAGKGLNAAVYTVMTRYMLRAYALEGSEPRFALARLNQTLSQCTPADVFVTLIYGVLDADSGRFIYADAGNEPPIVYSSDSARAEAMESTGPGLALVKHAVYTTAVVDLAPGDVIILYTDGITDAGGGLEGRLGQDRLLETVEAAASGSAQEIADSIVRRALDFSNGRMEDDAALVAIKAMD